MLLTFTEKKVVRQFLNKHRLLANQINWRAFLDILWQIVHGEVPEILRDDPQTLEFLKEIVRKEHGFRRRVEELDVLNSRINLVDSNSSSKRLSARLRQEYRQKSDELLKSLVAALQP